MRELHGLDYFIAKDMCDNKDYIEYAMEQTIRNLGYSYAKKYAKQEIFYSYRDCDGKIVLLDYKRDFKCHEFLGIRIRFTLE